MNSLSKLIASDNNFQTFPNLKKLERLVSVDLSRNNIKSIPDQINRNYSLEEFIMKSNKLACVPIAFRELNRLSRLDLQGNGL